jgi:FixJ family two-component response regulator
MQAGAFDFLQKPFRDQDLIDRIQRALAKDRANRTSANGPWRFTARGRWKRGARTRWRSSCE